MALHTAAVARGAGDKFVIADLPFLSFPSWVGGDHGRRGHADEGRSSRREDRGHRRPRGCHPPHRGVGHPGHGGTWASRPSRSISSEVSRFRERVRPPPTTSRIRPHASKSGVLFARIGVHAIGARQAAHGAGGHPDHRDRGRPGHRRAGSGPPGPRGPEPGVRAALHAGLRPGVRTLSRTPSTASPAPCARGTFPRRTRATRDRRHFVVGRMAKRTGAAESRGHRHRPGPDYGGAARRASITRGAQPGRQCPQPS